MDDRAKLPPRFIADSASVAGRIETEPGLDLDYGTQIILGSPGSLALA